MRMTAGQLQSRVRVVQGLLLQVSRKADSVAAAGMAESALETMLAAVLKLAVRQHSKPMAIGAAAVFQALLSIALSGESRPASRRLVAQAQS